MSTPTPKPYAMQFAENLRRLRTKAKMSGKQATEAITQQGFELKWRTYYSWELGERSPPMDALPAIAAAMGVSLRALFPAPEN